MLKIPRAQTQKSYQRKSSRNLFTTMKKRLLGVLLPLIFILFNAFRAIPTPSLTSAAASVARPTQGDYACILEDAFFYSVPDERRGIFLLPQTYYVRLLEYGTEFCKIEYGTDSLYTQRLIGYAKTKHLTFVEYVPVQPYLHYLFDVTYRIEEGNAVDSSFLTQLTMTCAYYGDYKIGSETYCYVLREGEFGYVPKPTSISYAENTEYADYLESLQTIASASTDDTPTQDTGQSASPLQIATLVALCLLVPLLAALILRPPRRPPYETEE